MEDPYLLKPSPFSSAWFYLWSRRLLRLLWVCGELATPLQRAPTGIHFPSAVLLSVCVQPLSRVWLSVTPWTAAQQHCCPRGSLGRTLEWVPTPSSRGSSWPRDWTSISWGSCIGRQILYHWSTWEAWRIGKCLQHTWTNDLSFLISLAHSFSQLSFS